MVDQAQQVRGPIPKPPNNVYTALLALSLLAVLASAALVAIKCYTQYGSIFKIP
jgi:hypothetical protein